MMNERAMDRKKIETEIEIVGKVEIDDDEMEIPMKTMVIEIVT